MEGNSYCSRIVPTQSNSETKFADGLAPTRGEEEITWSWFYKELRGSRWTEMEGVSILRHSHCRPFCRLVFSSHFPSRWEHFEDSTVCLPLGIGHRPRIYIHRCANVRMPQKFLLNLQVYLQRTEQHRIRIVRGESPVRVRGLNFDHSTDHHTALNMDFKFFHSVDQECRGRSVM